MQRITFKTRKKREILDITKTVEALLQKNHAQATGICNLLILHTTAALTTADLDPGTDLDMLDAFEAMIPKLHYRHPHNPAHVPDHILSALIGTSVALPPRAWPDHSRHLAAHRAHRTGRSARTRTGRERYARRLATEVEDLLLCPLK